jgi:hypothetical protein
VWWWIPVIPALWSWRQEDREFKAILGYTVSFRTARTIRPCLKRKRKKEMDFLKPLSVWKVKNT